MNFDLAVLELAIEKDTKMAKHRLAVHVALLAVALGLLTTGALSQSIFTSKVLKQVVALHHFNSYRPNFYNTQVVSACSLSL